MASAARFEKRSKKVRRFDLTDPAEDIGPMVAGRLAEQARSVDDTASLGIVGTKPEGFNPSEGHGARAHRAGFQRHPDRASVQARLTKLLRSRTNGDHLRMRGGVEASAHRIAGLGDDLAVLGYDGSDGHLPVFGGFAREVERAAHRQGQRKAHASRLIHAARSVDSVIIEPNS